MIPSHGSTNSLGVINIGIQDGQGSRTATPEISVVSPPTQTASAQGHRRGRGSISDNMGQKFVRNVRDRLRDRSASRNRTMTTSPQPAPYESMPRPYETAAQSTALAHPKKATQQPVNTTRSPYETSVTQMVTHSGAQISEAQQQQEQAQQQAQQQAQEQQQPTLLPSTTYGGYRNPKDIARQIREEQAQVGSGNPMPDRVGAQSVPPMPTRSNSVYQGYKSRELRANMPPGQLQYGVEEHPDGSGRI
jgi:hypothetical protein